MPGGRPAYPHEGEPAVKHPDLFLTDAQLASEIARCVYCEEKPCTEACPADCSPADFIMAAKTDQVNAGRG